MNKAVAIITGLMTLIPAAALADSYKRTETYIEEHHFYRVEHRPATGKYQNRPARGHGRNDYREPGDSVFYGKVIDVEPVYRLEAYRPGHASCIRRLDQGRPRTSYTPTVLGAIVGGVVGHRLGDHRGDPEVAAIAGGILGASVGRDIGNRLAENRYLAVDGPCFPRRGRVVGREVVEYIVTYRYNGEIFRTSMDYDPGEWVALDVDVKPA